MSKGVFISNVANKQNFIDMLSQYLQFAGCLTEHAEEDADMLIVQTAMQSAATKNIVLVADDTDLVILLCYYADPDGFDLFMNVVFDTRLALQCAALKRHARSLALQCASVRKAHCAGYCSAFSDI